MTLGNWSGPDISGVGALMGDPARVAILSALASGVSLPAGELADAAAVKAATASFHLSKLIDAGWLAVEQHGRHRYYRLASPEVAALLEHAAQFASSAPPNSYRASRQREHLSRARTCYDHLAGTLGVDLMRALLAKEVLTDEPYAVSITASGKEWLESRQIDVGALLAGRRRVLAVCMDWTERRHHLSGGLGAAILQAWLTSGYVARGPVRRSVHVLPAGLAALAEWGVEGWA